MLTYLPDHEPALGTCPFRPAWWMDVGGALPPARSTDSTASTPAPNTEGLGWGHSWLKQTLAFGALAGVKHLVPFHHDPSHTDTDLDRLFDDALATEKPAYRVTPAREGAMFEI